MKGDWKLILVVGMGLVAALFFVFIIERQRNFYQELSEPTPTTSFQGRALVSHRTVGNSTTTLMFVGDIMLDRGVEHLVSKYGSSFKFPFLEIENTLSEADLLFGNLESVVTSKGHQMKETYPFRADPQAGSALAQVGFDVVSLANNHALDYGPAALRDSVTNLERAGIEPVGAGLKEKAYSPVVQKRNLKVAYLAYTNLGSQQWAATSGRAGVAWLNEKNLRQGVNRAEEKADLVVVSFHLGEEYSNKPTPNQQHYSRLAIDSGADLVVGHHPHVIQRVEKYKGGWIAYSLGNFVFDQDFSRETRTGLLLRVIVEGNAIDEVVPREIRINEKFQPTLDL